MITTIFNFMCFDIIIIAINCQSRISFGCCRRFLPRIAQWVKHFSGRRNPCRLQQLIQLTRLGQGEESWTVVTSTNVRAPNKYRWNGRPSCLPSQDGSNFVSSIALQFIQFHTLVGNPHFVEVILRPTTEGAGSKAKHSNGIVLYEGINRLQYCLSVKVTTSDDVRHPLLELVSQPIPPHKLRKSIRE